MQATRRRWVEDWRRRPTVATAPMPTTAINGTLILHAPIGADPCPPGPAGWTLSVDRLEPNENRRVLIWDLRSHPVAAHAPDEALWTLATSLAPPLTPREGGARPIWRMDTDAGPCEIIIFGLSFAPPKPSRRRVPPSYHQGPEYAGHLLR